MKRFFIVAGESSGDLHAARLMRALRERYPGCRFDGIGGSAMAAEGLESLVPLNKINVVGFWEVAKRYSYFQNLLDTCGEILRSRGPYDAFIPVDYPGFNLRLCAAARAANIPVCYYIAPQLWAWGSGRARKMRKLVDVLMVVFPFEEGFFRDFGITTRFVGHPLLDDPAFAAPPPALDEREPVLAILPGSREQEVNKNLPVMLAVAFFLGQELPGYTFEVAVAPNLDDNVWVEVAQSDKFHNVRVQHNSRAVMRRARAGIVKTGTSTLEAALLGMPFVMAYRTSLLSYWIGRMLVKLDAIALANIIAGKKIVPELIQGAAHHKRIAAEVRRLIDNAGYAENMFREFSRIRAKLGEGGAAERAAHCIAEVLEGREGNYGRTEPTR